MVFGLSQYGDRDPNLIAFSGALKSFHSKQDLDTFIRFCRTQERYGQTDIHTTLREHRSEKFVSHTFYAASSNVKKLVLIYAVKFVL